VIMPLQELRTSGAEAIMLLALLLQA